MRVRIILIGLVGALIGWLDAPEASDGSVRERELGSERKAGGSQVAAIVEPEGPVLVATGPAELESRPRIRGSREQGYRSEGARFYVWQPTRADLVSWLAELAPLDRGAYRLPTDSADTAQS